MTDLTPNIPLLRKAVEWAEAEAAKPEPESEWDQGWWMKLPGEREINFGIETACQTAYCIAGWTCHSAGEGPTVDSDGRLTPGGQHVADRASQLLGLNHEQSNRLFSGRNTIEDVRRIAEDIAGERL